MPRALGLLAIVFYAAHAANLWRLGLAPHAAWSCHLSCLVLAAGLFLRSARLNSIAFLWLCAGLPAWIGMVVGGGDFHLTSTLTHLGGLALATVAVLRTGMPRGSWWRAAAGLVVLWALSRALFAPEQNVNLSHRHWFGFEAKYVAFPLYLAGLLTLVSLSFLGIERGIRRLSA